jgi:HD-GYP domain-containing protein (c-di-GMP phosphodiesterase class II)
MSLAAPTAAPTAVSTVTTVSLSEVLTALSHALDLTEGQPIGHTVRSCLIGMRLADEVGLAPQARTALYYALLIKDSGCSSNAAHMCTLFGADDRVVKPRMRIVDWHHPLQLALATFRCAGLGGPLREHVRRFAGIARSPGVTRELIQIRCDRGADIARELGFPDDTAAIVRALDEHWNGRGYPDGLRGDAIPIGARIANLAQTLEAFVGTHGPETALRVARERSGSWFDPRLVGAVSRWRHDADWWRALSAPDAVAAATALEPGERPRQLDDAGLDGVARAFGGIIDAKSPYTARHSERVAEYAVRIARARGLGADAERRLHRAGLLHDVGKLGVSNRILDKAGPLTAEERLAVQAHPRHTWEILSRVGAFADFARPAALHHEKLDGSGYPWGLAGDALDDAARTLAVADIYEALTADRPYRAGMPPAAALAILRRERGAQLCADAVDALAEVVDTAGDAVADAAEPAPDAVARAA